MTTALIISPSPAVLPDRVTESLPTPFSRCFEGMPAFGSPLVLLSFLVNLLAFRNGGFSLLRRAYTFGPDGPSRIHSDHYHQVETHESGTFDLKLFGFLTKYSSGSRCLNPLP